MVYHVLVFQRSGTTHSWSAPRIIGLLVTFAVVLVGFLAVDVLTPISAMAPTRVILNRSIGGSMLFMFLVSDGLMVVIYYPTIWFQVAQGQSAMEAGTRTIPLVFSLLVGIVSAIFTKSLAFHVPAMLLTPSLCAIGGGMHSTLTPSAGSSYSIVYKAICGFGIGCSFQAFVSAPQDVLPRADVPLGMALRFFKQQLCGSVFDSFGQNAFSIELVGSICVMAGLNIKAIVSACATAYCIIVPSGGVNAVIKVSSYDLTRVSILTAAISACMILGAGIVESKSVKGKRCHRSKSDEANEKGKSEVNEEGKSEAKN